MPAEAVTRSFRDWGKANGFRRKGTTLYRDQGETMAVINLQGSQWGGAYYVNVCWWLKVLAEPSEPKPSSCHIQARLDSFVPNEAELTRVLRDDGGLSEPEREARLREMLDSYLLPHLDATRSVAEIKADKGGWLGRVGVTGPAVTVLGR